MKHIFVLIALVACIGNTINAQSQSTAAWKDKVVGKWKYIGIEEFGVVTPADSLSKTNWLEINADGTFRTMEKNVANKGTYAVNESAKTIVFKDGTGKTKLYNLKPSDAGVLLMEYQNPKDLVRTRYRYAAMK